MLKTNFMVFFFFFTTLQLLASDKQPHSIEQNASKAITSFNLLKVNNHLISSDIFPTKKANALRYKFKKNEKKVILNQLINDEIAIQYAFTYLKLDDNISDEKKRLAYGLKLIDKIAVKELFTTISDKNASDYYTAHKKDYWHKKMYEASHILVKDENLSKSLIKKIKASKDKTKVFQTLAKKHSTDLAAKNGGYLGHFESKIMVKPFKDALEKLKIGDFTKSPVKTKFGYHIILLHNIAEEGYIPFERIKDEIKFKLANDKKAQWFEKTLLPLKKKATIDYLFDVNKSY